MYNFEVLKKVCDENNWVGLNKEKAYFQLARAEDIEDLVRIIFIYTNWDKTFEGHIEIACNFVEEKLQEIKTKLEEVL